MVQMKDCLSQQNGSSEFVRHDPCPDCGSSDGLAVYTIMMAH